VPPLWWGIGAGFFYPSCRDCLGALLNLSIFETRTTQRGSGSSVPSSFFLPLVNPAILGKTPFVTLGTVLSSSFQLSVFLPPNLSDPSPPSWLYSDVEEFIFFFNRRFYTGFRCFSAASRLDLLFVLGSSVFLLSLPFSCCSWGTVIR